MHKWWLACLIALLLVTPASAGYYITGAQLNEYCQRENKSMVAMFTVGVLDQRARNFELAAEMVVANRTAESARTAIHSLMKAQGGDMCSRDNVSAYEQALLVCEHLKDNQSRLSEMAAVLVVEAVSKASPCKR